MPTTQEIIAAAHKLGDLIAEHDAAKKMEAVMGRLKEDTDAQRALNDYNRHMEKVSQLEAQGKPVEVADKHKLQELQNAVVRNPLLRDMQMAQMDYLDLMRQVDEAMGGGAQNG